MCKNTPEKGHNFEPRNPRVPAFRVLLRLHIPAKRVIILNLKIPVFRGLIQKCIPVRRVHFILKSCDMIVELVGHLSILQCIVSMMIDRSHVIIVCRR